MTAVQSLLQPGRNITDAGFVHNYRIWEHICTRSKPLNTFNASCADVFVMTDDDLQVLWMKLLMLTPHEASAPVPSAWTAKPIQSCLC